jgi:hypothetical protein
MIEYKSIPIGCDLNTVFPTYVLAFCPDTDSWFATNNRFFFYEYPVEFDTEQEAINYFKDNIKEFLELNLQIMRNQRPNFNYGGVYLENEKQFIKCE